jgi:hypothetical protein
MEKERRGKIEKKKEGKGERGNRPPARRGLRPMGKKRRTGERRESSVIFLQYSSTPLLQSRLSLISGKDECERAKVRKHERRIDSLQRIIND